MSLQFIFDELCKGNLSVLTFEANQFISAKILEALGKPKEHHDDIKLLVMIGNICYNRTDMTVLPIEDGAYDLLMEIYKKFDPNFQVGSKVIEFQELASKEMAKAGIEIIDPIKFFNPREEQEETIEEYYRDRLLSFDKDKYNYNDIFSPKTPIQQLDSISKRLHDTKHNHPSLVGTLDKVKFVLDQDAIEKDVYDKPSTAILERDFFWKHINAGIITKDQQLQMVLELKYDGISVEADCSSIVESARTRGDTGAGEASDITPILYGYDFPRNTVLKDRIIGVKFEAIMKYQDLVRFNQVRGTKYANARTAIIGLIGSGDGYLYRDFITLIPLAVDRDDVPEVKNRMEEIELLNSLFKTKGEPLRYCYIQGDYQACLFLIQKFLDEAKYAREYLNFMFDGIVVSYLDEEIRNKLGRENFVNKYSIAVKFDALSKLTTFLGYTFNVGQTGNICPMIHYSPVEFLGTIHPKSSGASRKRFMDLALRPGDVIEVTYTNDVMPYVTKPDNEHNRNNPNPLAPFPTHCPCCGGELVFSNSGDSAKCINWYCEERMVARLTATFAKLGLSGFGEATARALNITNIYQINRFDEDNLKHLLGEADGSKLYREFHKLQHVPIKDYILFASLGFTNIGKETWKKIFSKVTPERLFDVFDPACEGKQNEEEFNKLWDDLCAIKGVGGAVMETLCREWCYFQLDVRFFLNCFYMISTVNIVNDGYSKIIRFSGCRHKELEQLMMSFGHDADGSAGVSKNTDILIVPYEGFQSTKTEKMSAEAQIIPIRKLLENFWEYIPVSEPEQMEYGSIVLCDIMEEMGIEV